LKNLQIRPRARLDVDEHFLRIGANNPEAALRFLDATEQAFIRIQGEPGVGSPRYAKTPSLRGLRMWPIKGFENYLTFYLEHENVVEVIRVLHGARDLKSILS
jgi:toxin ParE1/3/4